MISAPLAALRRRLAQLARDRAGVSAVEFAMLLPIMLTLYFGAVEITQGLSVDRKVTLAARVSADLVTQASSVDTAALNGVFQAAQAMITPYPISSLKVTITEVKIDGQGQPSVVWSHTFNGDKRSGNVTLPAGLVVKNTYLIWGEVSYEYSPTVGYIFKDKITLTDQIFMRPRLTDKVDCSTCTPPT